MIHLLQKLRRRAPDRKNDDDISSISPSPYSEINPCTKAQSQPSADEDRAIGRLRRFLAWQIAQNYDVRWWIPRTERPNRNESKCILSLAKKYCLLLGLQFSSRKEIARIKEELISEVFEPADSMGIPADVMEFYLNTIRVLGSSSRGLGGRLAKQQPVRMLAIMAIDYHILFDTVIQDTILRIKLKSKCLHLHKTHFSWKLSPRLLDTSNLTNSLLPSFSDPNRQPGQWPNVSKLVSQSWRPNETLRDPTRFPQARIDYFSFTMWRRYPRDFKQPSVMKCRDEAYRSRLPTVFLCAGLELKNPDGGTPKTLESDSEDGFSGL